MKPGRPVSHIKPTYISWKEENTTEFYPLNSKGEITQTTPCHVKTSDSTKREEDFIVKTYPMDLPEPTIDPYFDSPLSLLDGDYSFF